MSDLPERMKNAHVAIVGDVMLDRYFAGSVRRISPEAPVPVVAVERVEDRGGGAGNGAANAAALGARATLVGLVGDDDEGAVLARGLAEARVENALVVLPGVRTTAKLRVVSDRQQLIRMDFEQRPRDDAAVQAALARLVGGPDRPGAVLVSDYAKGALDAVADLIALARDAGLPVVVDPKGADFARYRGATVVTPNLAEFEAVAGRIDSDEALVARARELAGDLGLGNLLVTRGDAGMSLVPATGEALRFPADAREVFDVTGAGDTVCGVLGAMLAAGVELQTAVRYANRAAGIVVGKFGTAVATLEEIETTLEVRHDRPHAGILESTALMTALATCRARGERIVFTNGCFDILHAGHVTYLRQARALGDRLVVGVNTDASVTRLKGTGRPVNALEDRMAVLAELAAVDFVVPFAEDTPERLITDVRPDVLVKGGDYTPETVVGAELVLAYGGTVRILDFLPGRSSSRVIEKCNESVR